MAEEALRGGSVTAPAPEQRPRPHGRSRASWHDQRGTAVVEFALVAPILFLLVFGILDFGRALNYYNQQTQLVGLGARSAAVNCNPDGTCGATQVTSNSIQQQLATQYATGELKNKTTVCISGTGQGGPVTVTASYHFHFLPLIGAVVGSPDITLTASQSERQEAENPNWANVCYTP